MSNFTVLLCDLVPPQITSYPSSQNVVKGSSISLSCTAQGTSLENVTWREEDSILEESVQITINITNQTNTLTSQLNIDNVKEPNQGNYSCTAYSEAGSDTKSISLFVTGKN